MQRPTAVTVFGILNIVFAVIGLFSMVAMLAFFSAAASMNNPVVNIIRESPAYAAWIKLSIPLGILSCMVLLVAGIGLLKMRKWARTLSIGYAVYALGFGAIGVVMNFLLVTRPMLERAAQERGPEAAGAMGGAIGASIGGCFGMIYPVLLIIFMLRPAIAAAFRPPAQPPPLFEAK